MIERVITFGEKSRMVGILCEPSFKKTGDSNIGVLFLNSGLLHHVGPYRLYVDIARALAKAGVVSFRFDLGGLGDSYLPASPKNDLEQVIIDIQIAMDALEQKARLSQFVLLGLCTGASNAHRAAVIDHRVIGVCTLSGIAYPTSRFYVLRYGPIFINPIRFCRTTFKILKNTLQNVVEKSTTSPRLSNIGWWTLPPKNNFVKECSVLFERGVHIYSIFTGGDRYYQYASQLQDTLSSLSPGEKLKTELNRFANHTYSSCEEREKLIMQICNWTTNLVCRSHLENHEKC